MDYSLLDYMSQMKVIDIGCNMQKISAVPFLITDVHKIVWHWCDAHNWKEVLQD